MFHVIYVPNVFARFEYNPAYTYLYKIDPVYAPLLRMYVPPEHVKDLISNKIDNNICFYPFITPP